MYKRQHKWLDHVEFAGVIANGRVFKGKNGKYVTFVTLGIDYGQYIDVTIQKPFGYRDGDVVHGRGIVRTQNHSEYIQSTDVKLHNLQEWRHSKRR